MGSTSVSGLSASVATVKGKTEELDDAINESVKAKGILFETLIPIFMLQVEEQINQKLGCLVVRSWRATIMW